MLSSKPMHGVSVRLFLVNGTPDGLRLIEKTNWSGIGVMCSRAQYPDVRDRPEFGRPCVYVLIGPSSKGVGRQAIYIGQADIGRSRLDQHAKGKDFWTQLILFTSKNADLNKADVGYLEARLIELAYRAKRADVENGTAPNRPILSEADQADAEAFLDDMLLLYPILGVAAFDVVVPQGSVPRSTLRLLRKTAKATGADTPEGFIVFKGSSARPDVVGSISPSIRNLRSTLLDKGVLEPTADALMFTQDYLFASPSAAAGVIVGHSINGRTAWKDETGRTLKVIQEARLAASTD